MKAKNIKNKNQILVFLFLSILFPFAQNCSPGFDSAPININEIVIKEPQPVTEQNPLLEGEGSTNLNKNRSQTPSTTSGFTSLEKSRLDSCIIKPSSSGQRMFFYQGDYNRLTSTAEELACLMAQYDLVQLTHGFTVKPIAKFSLQERQKSQNLALVNGGSQNDNVSIYDGAYQDLMNHDISDLIRFIRYLRGDSIKIYAYVPATADNALGGWSSVEKAQNFLCPSSGCLDFLNWVAKWNSITSVENGVWFDGFFVDMVNELYVHEASWINAVSAVRLFKHPIAKTPYPIMANTLATEAAYYYPALSPYQADGSHQVQTTKLSQRGILFAEKHLVAGDSVLVEGWYFKAGHLNLEETENIINDLKKIKPGVTWSAITNEYGYKSVFLMDKYVKERDLAVENSFYLDQVNTSNKIEQIWTLYQQSKNMYHDKGFLDIDDLLYNSNYAYQKNQTDMAKFIYDFNKMLNANQDSEKLCNEGGYDKRHITVSEAYITSQQAATSCLKAYKFVDCNSQKFTSAKNYFNSHGGKYLTYTEANLGTYSRLISSCSP